MTELKQAVFSRKHIKLKANDCRQLIPELLCLHPWVGIVLPKGFFFVCVGGGGGVRCVRFKTKTCDFPYPISKLSENRYPILDL